MKQVSLVVPVFNEEAAVAPFVAAVRALPALTTRRVEIVFVNDGSRDGTLTELTRIAAEDRDVVVVDFSRNFGKEPALLAGIEHASGDCVIPMDVDMQDPIEVVPALLEKWDSGFEVVLAKRSDRSSDSRLKRLTASMFYRFHNLVSSVKIEPNVGDFRLLDRKVVEAILCLPERHLFMKGLFAWAGFNTAVVEYARPSRSVGVSKFNGWKLWNLALEGITSFSSMPLKVWTYVGSAVAIFALAQALVITGDRLVNGSPFPGYAAIMVAVLLLGGIQLIGIGVLGEYIGRIYMETKQRPRFVVRQIINGNGREQSEAKNS